MSDFFISPQARLDLIELWQFIAEEDVDAADRVIKEIHEAFLKVAEMPGIGHLREDLVDEPLRFWPVYSYLIIYLAEVDPLEIVRVLHSRRDIRALLN
ncbi:MAG: type II toxin-antitoxin system RelE/ParE family toxin [Blastocatellia bacterium]